MDPKLSRDPSGLAGGPAEASHSGAPLWERPSFEVIGLDCEITAYAPDGDGPLF